MGETQGNDNLMLVHVTIGYCFREKGNSFKRQVSRGVTVLALEGWSIIGKVANFTINKETIRETCKWQTLLFVCVYTSKSRPILVLEITVEIIPKSPDYLRKWMVKHQIRTFSKPQLLLRLVIIS